MNFTSIKYKANYYALLVLSFVIPLDKRLIAPAIIIFLFTSIINGSTKRVGKKKVILFLGIYGLYMAGLAYSSDMKFGGDDLMTKLSLLIFPISFFLSKINFNEKIQAILIAFIEGCFVSSIIAIIVSAIKYYYSFDLSLFFYGNIALFMHSSYLAMFLSLCIAIIYYYTLKQNQTFRISLNVRIVLLAFFSIFIVLLSSKTGLITMLLIHFGAIAYLIVRNKAYLMGGLILSLLLISLFFAYKTSDLFKGRIDEIITVMQSEKVEISTTGARKTIWITAIDLIKENPFSGYGTGDAKNVLVNEYKNRGLNFLYEKKLNAHNQFLQTGLAIGLFGMTILILMLLIPLVYAIQRKYYLYATFLMLIVINFLTEAMLERQVGVVFYSFFNALFFIIYFDKIEPKKE